MFSFSFISAAILGASMVVAADKKPDCLSACDLSHAQVPVPAGFTVPTVPPSFVGLGVGVQNYTYNATSGAYVSAGAVADLYDVSCFVSSPWFNDLTNITYDIWAHAAPATTTQEVIRHSATFSLLPVLGQHYFVQLTPNASIVPKWDFTSSGATKGNKNAFVTGAKDFSAAGARPAIDVPSLQLHNTTGELATTIYRLGTVNGQPPSNFTGSKAISVKYTALYYFIGYNA